MKTLTWQDMAYYIFHDTWNIQYINFMKYTIYKFPVSKYILCEPDTDGVGGLILLIMGSSSATESSLYWHTTLWLEGADLWNRGVLRGGGTYPGVQHVGPIVSFYAIVGVGGQ